MDFHRVLWMLAQVDPRPKGLETCTSPWQRCLYRYRQPWQTIRLARTWANGFRRSRKSRRLRERFARRGSIVRSRAAGGHACHESPETCAAFLLFWLRLRSRAGFLAINIFVADIARGIRVNRSLIDPRQHALHFSGR